MAKITGLKLALVSHDRARRVAVVKVTYQVLLSMVERKMAGLTFTEKIQLWGSDNPDPDDFLYQFPTATFPTEADGVVTRARTVTLGDDVLDEDGFPRPTDEVYAKVWVTPKLPSQDFAKSNVVEHKF